MSGEGLVAADREHRGAEMAKMKAGWDHPVDGSYWRDRARSRRDALVTDDADFGLVPHEERELEILNELIGEAE